MAIFSSLSRLNDVLRFDYLRGNLIVKDRALRALFLAGRRGYGDHECPVCNVGRAPRQVTRVRSRLPMATCPSLFARIGATPSAALEVLLGDVHRLGHVELEFFNMFRLMLACSSRGNRKCRISSAVAAVGVSRSFLGLVWGM